MRHRSAKWSDRVLRILLVLLAMENGEPEVLATSLFKFTSMPQLTFIAVYAINITYRLVVILCSLCWNTISIICNGFALCVSLLSLAARQRFSGRIRRKAAAKLVYALSKVNPVCGDIHHRLVWVICLKRKYLRVTSNSGPCSCNTAFSRVSLDFVDTLLWLNASTVT